MSTLLPLHLPIHSYSQAVAVPTSNLLDPFPLQRLDRLRREQIARISMTQSPKIPPKKPRIFFKKKRSTTSKYNAHQKSTPNSPSPAVNLQFRLRVSRRMIGTARDRHHTGAGQRSQKSRQQAVLGVPVP